MEEILQIRINGEYFNNSENKEKAKELYTSIINSAIKNNIWDDSIKKIIVTDDFINEIEKQASAWKIRTKLSKEKEYSVASKVLFNHDLENPEYHIFFHLQNLYEDNFPHYEVALKQILNVSAKKIIPKEIREFRFNHKLITLEDYLVYASTEWCKAIYTRIQFTSIITPTITLLNHNSLLTAFKRKLKRNLFEYNSDNYDEQARLDILWNNYFDSIDKLFLRLVENQTTDSQLRVKDEDPCKDLIYRVVFEIGELTMKCIKQEPYDIAALKEAIVNFSAHYEIYLEEETDEGFRIRLTKNPKDYFINEIVETEPRIICFMDILGFSELINEYENDMTSTLLQDIQESFELAKNQLLENKTPQNEEILKHLRYQTFSDNICISIPYFDNENDFLSNFNILSIYVRGFQLIMMSKGIFMRGGISTGSYYADSNIIFSKGLVNAYLIESKKAIYPRVVIDNSIISKLLEYNKGQVRFFGIDSTIIFDWENVAFLNPFGFSEVPMQQLNSALEELISDDDSEFGQITSLAKSLADITKDLFKNVANQERKGLQEITIKVLENIMIYKNQENIVSKYLWLYEFIKWHQNDITGKLKFVTLKDRLVEHEK